MVEQNLKLAKALVKLNEEDKQIIKEEIIQMVASEQSKLTKFKLQYEAARQVILELLIEGCPYSTLLDVDAMIQRKMKEVEDGANNS